MRADEVVPAVTARMVRLFDTDDDRADDEVVEFIAAGLTRSEAIVVFATEVHRRRFTAGLAARGHDVEAARRAGRLTMLDAEEAVARFMVDGAPDPDRFRDVLDAAIAMATHGDASIPIRMYGDLIDPQLWNDAHRERPSSLVFQRRSDRRRALDGARNLNLRQTQQLVQVTSAIAEAVTPEQVYAAIVDEVCAALHASTAGLFLLDEDARVLRLVRSSGYLPEHLPKISVTPIDVAPAMPANDCVRSGAALWIESQEELLRAYPHLTSMVTPGRSYRIACLPLMGRGRAIACIGLTFDNVPSLDDAERDFLRLSARYAGQALERLRLLEGERRSRERAELLYGLAREVIVAASAAQVFEAALDAIETGLGATRASILTYGDDPVMKFRAWRGLSDGYRAAVEGHSPWPRDTRDPAPVIVADVAADPALADFGPLFESEQIGALAFIPLVSGQQLVGKFMLYYEEPHALRDDELDLARGIADHVAAAVARFAAFDELRETVRFNEMFTGILGHDLRNPLGAIVTAAQLAIARSPGERITKPLSRILSSSSRMTRMIEQLLDFTRVRVGGGIPLVTQPIDLLPVVRQVMEELEDANPDWSLRLDVAGSALGAWDPDRLAQVFSNIVANAVQYGEVTVGVRVRVDGTLPDRVQIEISNGGAIPQDLLPTIFDPMAGSARRRDGSRGLGLGLYVSREIIRAHRGWIAVRSEPDTETVFTIELPR